MIDFALADQDKPFEAKADHDVDAGPPQHSELRHSDRVPVVMDVKLLAAESLPIPVQEEQGLRKAQIKLDFTDAINKALYCYQVSKQQET